MLAFGRRVLGDVVLRQFDQVGVGREDRRHIFNPRHIFADSGVGYLKLLGQWMESDADADRLIVLRQDLAPEQTRHECGHAPLTVDEDAFTSRRRAVLEFHGWISPRDEITLRSMRLLTSTVRWRF